MCCRHSHLRQTSLDLPRVPCWRFFWCWTFDCLFSTASFSCCLQWGGCREKMQICRLVGLRFFLANEVVSLFPPPHYLSFKPPFFHDLFLTTAAVLGFTSSCQYFKPIQFVQTQTTDKDFMYSHEMESDEWWPACAWTMSPAFLRMKAYVHSCKVPYLEM